MGEEHPTVSNPEKPSGKHRALGAAEAKGNGWGFREDRQACRALSAVGAVGAVCVPRYRAPPVCVRLPPTPTPALTLSPVLCCR